MRVLLAVLVAAGAAQRRSSSSDCTAKAVYPDGTEEERECTLMNEKQLAPGTKARFESCTQVQSSPWMRMQSGRLTLHTIMPHPDVHPSMHPCTQ